MVSSHHVLNECTLSFFNSTFKMSLRSKTDSCVSLTLKYSKDHPCDLPSREKAFFSCADPSRMRTHLLKSPLMIFLRPLAILESTTSKFVCHLSPVLECDVFRSEIDFAGAVSFIHIIASIGRLAHEDTSLLKLNRQILKFLKSSQGLNSSFSASFLSGKLCLQLFWLLRRNIRSL